MKRIIHICLGSSRDDFHFDTTFQGQKLELRRTGTDGDLEQARQKMLKWNKQADAIALSEGLPAGKASGPQLDTLLELGRQLDIPVTAGDTLRGVVEEWALRYTHFRMGNNYFTNARVLFLSGLRNRRSARVMSEFTDNLFFADPLLEKGLPRLAGSLKELDLYDGRVRGVLDWVPGRRLLTGNIAVRKTGTYLLQQALRKAHVLVVPHHGFFRYLEGFDEEDLADKIVLTSAAYEDRVEHLSANKVAVVIDPVPKLFERVVGVSLLEAVLRAVFQIPGTDDSDDDLLEIISDLELEPRIIYPSGQPRRINRFAYIVYPPTQEYFKKIKPIEALAERVPSSLDSMEKALAYAPPFVYSKVSGIRSTTGVEAEGWLIALGQTPDRMQALGPEFTTRRLLWAAKLAKRLGAQVMGIGMFPKALKDTSEEVGKHAVLPITTGNSYTASAALWASAEVVRRMGLVKLADGKRLEGKTMVIGATGAVGAICSRLLAKAFTDVHMVSRNMAKLLSLQDSIASESPAAVLSLSTRADTRLEEMDLIVAASSGAGRVLDMRRLKPGCVVTDMNLPTIFSNEDVAKRLDVLMIQSGAIELPGHDIEMKDIGLAPGIVYPGLAETILLALEGRYETFTEGSRPRWDRVREIYRLGLKHGMRLAAISGLDGVLSDEVIDRVRTLAVKGRGQGAGDEGSKE